MTNGTPRGMSGDKAEGAPVWAAMRAYLAAGWHPFPLDPGTKHPPLAGFTGRSGKVADESQIERWEKRRPDDSNVAIRMPDGVIALDVDKYHRGGKTIAALTARLGSLPEGPRNLSGSGDGSGHRYFRVPKGREFATVAGPGVEVLQRHHRYSVVWPSVHPDTGKLYEWADSIPDVESLPELPAAWVKHFDAGAAGKGAAKATSSAAKRWASRVAKEPCFEMAASVSQAITNLHDPEGVSRHDVMVKATRALSRAAEEGHGGLDWALNRLHEAWAEVMAGEPVERQDREFERAVNGALMLAAAGGARAQEDPCEGTPPPPPATSETTAAVLDRVDAFVRRFVSYPSDDARTAHVLWIAHTHLMDRWDSTPRISFQSPERNSGKSRALEVTAPLVPNPVHAVNCTSAYLFRKVSAGPVLPTILYDEIDTVFGPKAKDHEDVRGIAERGAPSRGDGWPGGADRTGRGGQDGGAPGVLCGRSRRDREPPRHHRQPGGPGEHAAAHRRREGGTVALPRPRGRGGSHPRGLGGLGRGVPHRTRVAHLPGWGGGP